MCGAASSRRGMPTSLRTARLDRSFPCSQDEVEHDIHFQQMDALVQLGAKTLTSMRAGETAFIDDVRAEPKERLRLLELGLVPGTAVRAVRRAPLGDPLEIELRGYRLSLGKDEAKHVRIA